MQSVINHSTADSIYFVLSSPDRSKRPGGRKDRGRQPADISLFGWFDARSELASKIGFAACVLFYGLVTAYGIAAGGHSQHVHSAIASLTNGIAVLAGFEIKAVQIQGRVNVQEADIASALGDYKGVSIFAFDTDQARQRLKRNGWIAEARVMRLLPSTLFVELEENKPFALWREGGKTAVIDAEGKVLGLASPSSFSGLPAVSGAGAAAPAKALIDAIATLPDLKARVQDIERIAGRRWDLVLDTGLRVKLPAQGIAGALADLSMIASKNPAALYEISEMDFRVPSQFTVRLKDESEKGRQKFLSWLSGDKESHSQGL